MGMYSLLWPAALPALALSSRLREGWRERTLSKVHSGPVDIWIQAASAGEAFLAREILLSLPSDTPLRVLVTSGTTQGMDILSRTCEELKPQKLLDVEHAYFPFDAPFLMKKALRHYAPRLVVTLETELWPGFLAEAKKQNIPVLLINGRMSAGSFASYVGIQDFLRDIGPKKILALNGKSTQRYAVLFGHERVETMQNIKFDRCPTEAPVLPEDHPLSRLLGVGDEVLVLGSVRKEEEPDILETLQILHRERPKTTIALFPRHMTRLDFWSKVLYETGLPVVLRSQLTTAPAPGTIILWDAFGELGAAYSLASAAFVGGSLKPLGGQNFLEPLIHGLVPVIGPHWKNFDWVGREIVESGLVCEVTDARQLARQVIVSLENPQPKNAVQKRAAEYISARTGGTAQAVACILRHL